MNLQPKRKKSKDNPYTIIKTENKYTIEFKDGKGTFQKVNVDKEVFDVFDKSELIDISQMTKAKKHIVNFDLSEEYINLHRFDKQVLIDDEVITKTTFEELRNAIDTLPDIQKRRIKLYYFNELTQQQIANLDNVDIRAIRYTLKIAIDNLNKILKNKKN